MFMVYVGGEVIECVSVHKEDWHQIGLCFYNFQQERTYSNIFFAAQKSFNLPSLSRKPSWYSDELSLLDEPYHELESQHSTCGKE